MNKRLGHLLAKMNQLIEAVDAALAAGSVANALASVQENEARQAMQALSLVGADAAETRRKFTERSGCVNGRLAQSR